MTLPMAMPKWKKDIEDAVEVLDFSVAFRTQARNGKTEEYAVFQGEAVFFYIKGFTQFG